MGGGDAVWLSGTQAHNAVSWETAKQLDSRQLRLQSGLVRRWNPAGPRTKLSQSQTLVSSMPLTLWVSLAMNLIKMKYE